MPLSEKPVMIELPYHQGRINGQIALIPGATLFALVMHPHPHRGGNMRSHVVSELCSTLHARGVSTLRFNFRPEAEPGAELLELNAGDARAAAAHLAAASESHKTLLLAGYSWGTVVASHVATDIGAKALGLVSPVVGILGEAGFDKWKGPTFIITGDDDFVCSTQEVGALKGGGDRDPEVVVLPGVDHFWKDGEAVSSAASQLSDWLVRQVTGESGVATTAGA